LSHRNTSFTYFEDYEEARMFPQKGTYTTDTSGRGYRDIYPPYEGRGEGTFPLSNLLF